MATKKQTFEQPKDNASAAGKPTPERKPSGGESTTSPGQSTSPNQGAQNQGAQSTQGTTGQNRGTGQSTATGVQGTANKQTPGQGTSGQQTGGQQNAGGQEDLLQHAKQATGEIVNQVQQQAGSQIARQKDSAATDLTQVVQAVRRFGESLTGQEGGPIARYAAQYGDKAADSLERFSTYIREQDPKQLLNDVQNFGRRRPALLLGGAFLLGLAGARLIKSSMSMESHHQSYHPNTPGMRPRTSPNAR
jgi:hypothetical protein